jgi:Delta24-sterol reductase
MIYRMKSLEIHHEQAKQIASQIVQFYSSNREKKLRFDHGSTLQLKNHTEAEYVSVDISSLNAIIEINTEQKFVSVEPSVPLDQLISQTLKYGLVPAVVPELPGITCGGAVIGGAGESSSYKQGLFDDICLAYEIILGDGTILQASENERSDIFFSIPWSYGTLGLLSLMKIKLVSALPYIHVTYQSFQDYAEAIAFMRQLCYGKEVEFIDGMICSQKQTIVMYGKFSVKTDLPTQTFSRQNDPWFYVHAQEVVSKTGRYEELIPTSDYFFRYNRGAFWTGKVFFEFLHIPYTPFTRKVLDPYLNTRAFLDAVRTLNLTRSFFVQDYITDFEKAAGLIMHADEIVGIYPNWLCPIRTFHASQKISPTNVLRDDILLNIGIYGRSKKYAADRFGKNKEIERYATTHHAIKVLYAEVFYSEEDFWSIYDKNQYDTIRHKYKADGVFPDLWHKVHSKEELKPTLMTGIPKLLLETLRGTFKNS